ncbi:MAG: hypothetical protein QME51_09670 [Planctomycetota bacterium]|nr:hypothetical protein [Planctomycetota bacterium]
MPLEFNCIKCGQLIVVRFLKKGEFAKCRKCKAEIIVPPDAIETNEIPQYLKSVSTPPSEDIVTMTDGTTIQRISRLAAWSFILGISVFIINIVMMYVVGPELERSQVPIPKLITYGYVPTMILAMILSIIFGFAALENIKDNKRLKGKWLSYIGIISGGHIFIFMCLGVVVAIVFGVVLVGIGIIALLALVSEEKVGRIDKDGNIYIDRNKLR